MSSCQTSHQLEVSEQHQDADLALPITRSFYLNLIENLWLNVTLETVKRHLTIKRKLIEPLIVAWNRGVTHDNLVKLSTQLRQVQIA